MSDSNNGFSPEDWTEFEMQVLRHIWEHGGNRWHYDSPFPVTAQHLAIILRRRPEDIETAVSLLWLHLKPFTVKHLSQGNRLDFKTITGLTVDGEKLGEQLFGR